MGRNSHTIRSFRGIMASQSVANIPPNSARDCRNVYGDTGGWINVCQRPTTLIDWQDPANVATNLAAILSLGFIPVPNKDPRLVIQQGKKILYADSPFTAAVQYGGGDLAGILARLDFAVANGITYFCNAQSTGYVLPPSSSGDSTRWFGWGILPPSAVPVQVASTSYGASITIQRTAGVTTVTFSSAPLGSTAVGQPLFVENAGGVWDATFNGVFKIQTGGGLVVTYNQPGLPDAGPFVRAIYPSGLPATALGGYTWGACYGSSAVVHFGSLCSLPANYPGNGQNIPANCAPVLMVPPSTDPQVDEVALFRNQDGGGSELLTNADGQQGQGATGIAKAVATGDFAGYYVLLDSTTDEQLTTSGQGAPYDNGVAPLGKYISTWLDRILMTGIPDDPTAVRYTGYDSISFGRPQMAWCQFNNIRLGQGQNYPCGMGLLRYGGMVFFATNGLMYIYRGTLNDVTISAPTSLSYYAEQLPYNIGLYSHFSVQSSSAGLVWLDDGFNLRVFENSGFYPPRALAPQLAGVLKRITKGSQDIIESAVVTYLQRDWYLLAVPVDGSKTNNMLIIVDLNQDQGANTGAWPTDYNVVATQWLQYQDGSKHLIAAMPTLPGDVHTPTAGYLTEIPLIDNVVEGVEDPLMRTPVNGPMPGAFWQGGYFGIMDETGEDEYSYIKMFRYIRHSSNLKDVIGFSAQVVDGETNTFDAPGNYDVEIDPDDPFVGGVNVKGRAMSLMATFPDDAPVPGTLTTLLAAWVTITER